MKNFNNEQKEVIAQFGQHGIGNLENIEYNTIQGCDLHNALYNQDYFIIGTYKAKELLKKFDVFQAIEEVSEYENDQFGEVSAELSNPEKLINMLAYIYGEQILSECKTLQKNWDKSLTKAHIANIIKEMQSYMDIICVKC